MPFASLASSSAQARARVIAAVPYVLVASFGIWVTWPIPAGQMPLSADHTVHLSRIAITADLLARGHVGGWSTAWFFGTPIGDLYPQLGDLWIIVVRALSLWRLDWPAAYALGFAAVFIGQGLVACAIGRAVGRGPIVGTVAGLLTLADPGYAREGGWLYTMWFGVWPQALATAACWLGLAKLWTALDAWSSPPCDPAQVRRRLAVAIAWLAAALLAHPMAATMLLLGIPTLLVVSMGQRRVLWRRHTLLVTLAMLLAGGLAAWWWLPMFHHRGYAASYGWLHVSLSRLVELAQGGEWTRRMPAAAGYLAAAGMVYALGWGSVWLRAVAVFALLQWLASASDVYWAMRPDRLSSGFTHIQYQRFLPAAKPGFFVLAGASLAAIVDLAWRWRSRWHALVPATVGLGAAIWLAVDTHAAMVKYEVGDVPLTRRTNDDDFEADYRDLLVWIREHHPEPGVEPPLLFRTGRNVHWLMDATAFTGVRVYKSGFTPGDNFVHKPETDDPAVLDRLGVRFVVTTSQRRNGERQVARFGSIRVLQRDASDTAEISITGSGQLDDVDLDLDHGLMSAELTDAAADTSVTFPVAGYPRWQLTLDGEPLDWYEVAPLHHENRATPAQRRAGQWRDGKALGNDGTAALLIAADVPRSGRLELRYAYRQWVDWVGGSISLLALCLWVLLIRPPRRVAAWIERSMHLVEHHAASWPPRAAAVLVGIVVLAIGVRWWSAARDETHLASSFVADERAGDVRSLYAGPIKADMLIRPAVLVKRRHRGDATATFGDVLLSDTIDGWFALDDDEAQLDPAGQHHLTIVARVDEHEHILYDQDVPHRPGRTKLSLSTAQLAGRRGDIIVRIRTEDRPTRLGFDLDLSPARHD